MHEQIMLANKETYLLVNEKKKTEAKLTEQNKQGHI